MRTPADPPTHLTPRSTAFWRSVVAVYVLDDPAALELLRRACECLDTADAARAEVERDGMTFRTRYDEIRPNPAVAIERDARNAFRQLARELRITEPTTDDRIPRHGRIS